jgi:orotate phosphoribosyltransferase
MPAGHDPASPRGDLGRAIYNAAQRRGSFVLRSGRVATEYFDKYQFEGDPRLLHDIAVALVPMVPPDTDALAGLELGGVPVATAMALIANLPVRYVRKKAKEYGTRQLVEGGPIAGLRLLIVEDVVTSGGQVIESTEALRSLGARIDHALCVIDREAGGVEALERAAVELRSLFRLSELQQWSE